MYSIVIILVLLMTVVLLTNALHDRTGEWNIAKKELSDLKAYRNETEAYMEPVTQENIMSLLTEKSIEANVIDKDTLTFNDGDVFIVDTEHLPMLHIKTGISLNDSYDWELIASSAQHVQDEVVMVETSVAEGKFVEFHISCCEQCMGHLEASWEYYRKIMAYSKELFTHSYNQLHDQKRNEEFMKKDSPEAQMQKVAEQMIATKVEEAEQNADGRRTNMNCVS